MRKVKRIRKNCKTCKTEIFTIKSRIRDGRGKFCSQKCVSKWLAKYKKEKAFNWKGGKVLSNGYIMIYKPEHPKASPQGYILEHRLKMEEKMGRYLQNEEVVHHINGDRRDNRIFNLKLHKSNSGHFREEHPDFPRDYRGRFIST